MCAKRIFRKLLEENLSKAYEHGRCFSASCNFNSYHRVVSNAEVQAVGKTLDLAMSNVLGEETVSNGSYPRSSNQQVLSYPSYLSDHQSTCLSMYHSPLSISPSPLIPEQKSPFHAEVPSRDISSASSVVCFKGIVRCQRISVGI